MRGVKAKRLRKQVYGDYSPMIRRYVRDNKTGVIRLVCRRREYQDAKRRHGMYNWPIPDYDEGEEET